MKPDSIATIAAAATPLVTAVLSGLWAVARTRRADRLLNMIAVDQKVASSLPDDSKAKYLLEQHIDLAAERYVRHRLSDVAIKRDTSGIVLGLIMAVAGIGLGWYALYGGGWFLFLIALAFPLMLLGIVGFFYELSGGKSRNEAKQLQKMDVEARVGSETDDGTTDPLRENDLGKEVSNGSSGQQSPERAAFP